MNSPLVNHSLSDLLTLWHQQSKDFALVFLDLNAQVVAANEAVTRIFGFEPAELMGATLRRIFTEDDLAKGLDAHEIEVAALLGRAEDDRWHIGKNQRRVWISGVMVPLWNHEGKHVGFAKLMRDRTDLRSELSTLENQVIEAHAAGVRKDEFLATLGHELRNPLSTITAACHFLKGRTAATPDDPVFAALDRQLVVFSRILDDLRDLARVDTGHLKLLLEPVDLQAAIGSAIDSHVPAAQARSQTLRWVFPQPQITLHADSVRLEQIIRNLLDNAIKYTHIGGEISVTATVEGSSAVIRVQDNGIGLSADVLPCIFDLFTRDDRVVDSPADGLGIGLALVKNLVNLHKASSRCEVPGLAGSESPFAYPCSIRNAPGQFCLRLSSDRVQRRSHPYMVSCERGGCDSSFDIEHS